MQNCCETGQFYLVYLLRKQHTNETGRRNLRSAGHSSLFVLEARVKGRLHYFPRRLPVVQDLDFCLIGRKKGAFRAEHRLVKRNVLTSVVFPLSPKEKTKQNKTPDRRKSLQSQWIGKKSHRKQEDTK